MLLRTWKEHNIVNRLCRYCYCSVAKSYLTLCDPMDCSPPGSSVHGILQARILECVAMPSSRGSSWPSERTRICCIDRQIHHQPSHQGNQINYSDSRSFVSDSATPWIVTLQLHGLPVSSVWGFPRQENWNGLPFLSPSRPRDGTWVSHTVGRFFTIWATREAIYSNTLSSKIKVFLKSQI